MFKSMFTRKEGHGNPKHMTFVSFVLPMTSGPWAFCECIGEFEKRSNLSYRFIFRESLAKVLLKPWRKTAFIWRLGGLSCGLAKASLQEYCSLGVEVSEQADEGEQGPKYYAKASNLNVQHCAATTEKLRWLICPRSCSILAWCTAKVKQTWIWPKLGESNLFSAKMSFSAWKNLEQPSYIVSPLVLLHQLLFTRTCLTMWSPELT